MMQQNPSRPHRLPIRVYYEDTDFSGLVYHASHLRFMERGRTELLRTLGLHQRDLHEGETGGMFFVVRAMNIDFKKPAMMDDLLTVETTLREIGGASLLIWQRVLRDGEVLVTAEVKVASVERGKSCRLPPQVKEKLLGALATAGG